MVSVATVVGILLLVGVNTVVAALATRFFRVRLATRWGAVLYTVGFVLVLYVGTTILLSGFVGFGGRGVGDTGTVLVLVWVLPLTLGYSIDYFWMPPPEQLPERSG